jgi:asparagine N-glycosylation enzyme membrane subunit Stt3
MKESTKLRIAETLRPQRAGKKNPMFGKSPVHTNRIRFISTKSQKEFVLKSTYELKAAQILERRAHVCSYEYEHYVVPFGERNCIPDFSFVDITGAITLVEVKPQSMLQLWNNAEKIEAMKFFAKKMDMNFELWTEAELFL